MTGNNHVVIAYVFSSLCSQECRTRAHKGVILLELHSSSLTQIEGIKQISYGNDCQILLKPHQAAELCTREQQVVQRQSMEQMMK